MSYHIMPIVISTLGMDAHIHMHAHACTHVYMHAYTHAPHTYTHTHTHTRLESVILKNLPIMLFGIP